MTSEIEKEINSANQLSGIAQKQLTALTGAAEQIIDVRKAMKTAIELFNNEWPQFVEDGRKCLEETRLWKMAQKRELNECIVALDEIRRFVNKADFAADSQRLKDFVDSAERLKKLHDSGFLALLLKGFTP